MAAPTRNDAMDLNSVYRRLWQQAQRKQLDQIEISAEDGRVIAKLLNVASVDCAPVFVTMSCLVLRVTSEPGATPHALKMTFGSKRFYDREEAALQKLAEHASTTSVPHIMSCGEVVAGSGVFGMSMPWYDTCLFDLVQWHKVTPRIAWSVVRAVADAYCVAHACKLVYMDLKLENVLLNADDASNPVLCDWNAAVKLDGGETQLRTTEMYNGNERDPGLLCSMAGEAWRLAVVIYAMVYSDFPRPADRSAPERFIFASLTKVTLAPEPVLEPVLETETAMAVDGDVTVTASAPAPAPKDVSKDAVMLVSLARELASRSVDARPSFERVRERAVARLATLGV
jgi:serine/threonine protein kinase